ncbi:UNVERIFIED_CONTAM: hypothetical protein Sradi_4059900 [Sesamum radiatum]|uniref:Uncharacterized protein n=1 Tax=Sesamum radiatum TaxID=300843 RepID=A0AAW2PIM4_SESRA
MEEAGRNAIALHEKAAATPIVREAPGGNYSESRKIESRKEPAEMSLGKATKSP